MAARRSRIAQETRTDATQYGTRYAREGSTVRLRLTMPEPLEADVLASVLEYLAYAERQGRVIWHARTNTGAGRLQRRDGTAGQWLRFGWPGCPDILGQLPGGRLLALEVKRPSGRVRPEQAAFLAKARDGGAVAAVVRSVDDVHRLVRG